jgi:hypothetical protein
MGDNDAALSEKILMITGANRWKRSLSASID